MLEHKYVGIEDLLNVYDYLQYKQHHIPEDLVLSSVFLLDKDGDRGSTVVKVLCYKSDKRRIVWILRIDPAHIPPDWTTRPQFRLWTPQGHLAVLWILAQMVWYRIKESRACTEQDYSDFLRQTRWKAYQNKHRRTNVGNYLEIL